MANTATSPSAESTAQSGFRVRLDWGTTGLAVQATRVDTVVIVDVLSFGTCVDVGMARGLTLYPWGGSHGAALQFARRRQARVAGSRRHPGDDGLSLSPSSLEVCAPGDAVVLPSLNGAALAREAARSGKPVYAASLRNAAAVGRQLAALEGTVGVIAAGERWPDRSLRPAFEDLLGAGAVIAAMDEPDASPEARAAVVTFHGFAQDVAAALAECASGRELREQGFGADVAIAAQLDVSECVPRLRGLAFENAA